jgi:arylsulfatase A-like enzyme
MNVWSVETVVRCRFVMLALVMLAMHGSGLASERPNVVFIMADDLGWNDVAWHGGNAPTPNLDRLAEVGVELSQHYVAPVCSPTRTGLMSGRCWSRFGVCNPQNELAMPLETVTLASALASVGYETCLTGKWHLGSLPEWGPNHFGFQHSYGSLAGGVSPWNHRYKMGVYSQTWHRNEQLLEEQGHVTDLLTDEAVHWIAARGSQPFFLYVPFTAVHLPIKEPQEWLDQVPSSIQGEVPRHYAACTMHLDHAVGRILAALQDAGKREETLVVFSSDNGGSTAENNDLQYPDDNCPNGKLPGSNSPWRGEKGSVYEGGTRVPTLIHWPGKIDSQTLSDRTVDVPIQIIDWMPTFCELAGYQTDEALGWDGLSLAGMLLRHEPLPERTLYAVGPSWRSRSVRKGDWKLIAHGELPAQKLELYNLQDDPYEQTNLVETLPERVQALEQELAMAMVTDISRQPAKTDRPQ